MCGKMRAVGHMATLWDVECRPDTELAMLVISGSIPLQHCEVALGLQELTSM